MNQNAPPKTILLNIITQENSRGVLYKAPSFEVSKRGPENAPSFIASVTVFGKTFHGSPCPTKRDAENSAAERALQHYRSHIRNTQSWDPHNAKKQQQQPVFMEEPDEKVFSFDDFISGIPAEKPVVSGFNFPVEIPSADLLQEKGRLFILIDLENMSRLCADILAKKNFTIFYKKDITCYGFLSIGSAHYNSRNIFGKYMEIKTISSTEKNAADVLMIASCVYLIKDHNLQQKDTIILLSSDKIFSLLSSAIETLENKPPKILHLHNMEDIDAKIDLDCYW